MPNQNCSFKPPKAATVGNILVLFDALIPGESREFRGLDLAETGRLLEGCSDKVSQAQETETPLAST